MLIDCESCNFKPCSDSTTVSPQEGAEVWAVTSEGLLAHVFSFSFFFPRRCFKEVNFKLDCFFNNLKDKHDQGEAKRRQRGHRSAAERKRVHPDSTEGEQAVRNIRNTVLANGKGLEASDGRWMQFCGSRQKLLEYETDWQTCPGGLSPHHTCPSHLRWLHSDSLRQHTMTLCPQSSSPPHLYTFISTLSFTTLSGMVSVCLQCWISPTLLNEDTISVCTSAASVWRFTEDVFSANLVKLSRQESVHFVEHSRDGRQEWFGPGFKVSNQAEHRACLLTMFRGIEGKVQSPALFITEKMMSCVNHTFSDGL